MSKRYDRFINRFFQNPYNWVDRKAPKLLIRIINFIGRFIKIPKFGDIVKVAYTLSREVEKEGVAGWIKKRKVIAGITKFAKSFGFIIPKVIANLINELVTVYIKGMMKR